MSPLFNTSYLADSLASFLRRDDPLVVGDRVTYDGFFGERSGVVTEVFEYASGTPFEFHVYLDNGRTALAKPRQVKRIE